MSEHVRFFGVTRRPASGAQPLTASHSATNTHRANTTSSLARHGHPPGQPANFPRVEYEGFSSRDQEFAAMCFCFFALVGLPLAIVAFVLGLIVSFG